VSRLERASGWAYLLLALVLPWSIAPMGIAAGLLVLLTFARWAQGERPRWVRTPVDLPAAGWALALLLSATFAIDRSGGFPRLTKALFPLLIGLSAWYARRESLGRRALAVVFASTALAALYGLVRVSGATVSLEHRASGAVGHYMTFGGQLTTFLCAMAGVAAVSRERRWRFGALAAALPALAALGATLTRSAWLGLGAGLFTVLALARPRWVPALVIAASLAVVFAPDAYRDRLRSAIDPTHETNRERLLMWQAGLEMFKDRPLTGVGLMDLKKIYAERYQAPESNEVVGHLHSVPVHVAATMGLAGLVALVALYASLFVTAARGLRDQLPGGGVGAGLRLGVTGALVAFVVSGLFEWNLGDEELLYGLYTLLGMAWAARLWRSDRGAGGPVAPPPAAPAGRAA
jgi:O-antigen ligase